jgi:hypothetical protein
MGNFLSYMFSVTTSDYVSCRYSKHKANRVFRILVHFSLTLNTHRTTSKRWMFLQQAIPRPHLREADTFGYQAVLGHEARTAVAAFLLPDVPDGRLQWAVVLSTLIQLIIIEDRVVGRKYTACRKLVKVKVKFSPLQALEALRVVRGWGSHIF